MIWNKSLDPVRGVPPDSTPVKDRLQGLHEVFLSQLAEMKTKIEAPIELPAQQTSEFQALDGKIKDLKQRAAVRPKKIFTCLH